MGWENNCQRSYVVQGELARNSEFGREVGKIPPATEATSGEKVRQLPTPFSFILYLSPAF